MANSLLDFVISLVRDPEAAARYAANPERSIAEAHLTDVTRADVNSLIPVVSDSLSMSEPIGAAGGAHGDILGHEGAALGSVDTVNAGVTPVEHGLVLPSGPLIHGGTGGYGGMNPPVTDAPAPQVPARAQPMTTAAEHTPAVTQPQHTPVEPPVHDKPPSHSVFDVGHEPPVTHTPPAPIELPSYGLFGLPGF